jgi:hypothetical protein
MIKKDLNLILILNPSYFMMIYVFFMKKLISLKHVKKYTFKRKLCFCCGKKNMIIGNDMILIQLILNFLMTWLNKKPKDEFVSLFFMTLASVRRLDSLTLYMLGEGGGTLAPHAYNILNNSFNMPETFIPFLRLNTCHQYCLALFLNVTVM